MSDLKSITASYPEPVHNVQLPPDFNHALLHYGGSAAAIIIAIAILLRAVGDMISVLVPVMLQRNECSQDTDSVTDLSQSD